MRLSGKTALARRLERWQIELATNRNGYAHLAQANIDAVVALMTSLGYTAPAFAGAVTDPQPRSPRGGS